MEGIQGTVKKETHVADEGQNWVKKGLFLRVIMQKRVENC